ncbi:MAG: ABC transporter ATP-binding protein [Ilumatobacter sp.]
MRPAWPDRRAGSPPLRSGSWRCRRARPLFGPLLLRYGIDNGIRQGDPGALNLAIGLYVLVAVVAYLGSRQQYVFVNRAGEGFLRGLRLRLFAHIQRQSLAFFDRNQAGVLVSRMTADIESMSELVQWGLLQFVSAALLVTFALVILLVMSWELTLLSLVVMPVIFVASIKFQRDSNLAYLSVRERIGENLSALQENITGVRVIQAYAREPEQNRRFRSINRDLYDAHLHSVRVSTWYFGVVEFCGVLATAIAIGTGGWLAANGRVSVGTVVGVVLLLSSLFEPVQQLSQMYNTVQSATASLDKMFQILDTEPEVDEAPEAVDLPRLGELEVAGITFSYPGTSAAVLRDVSLSVAPGERLALVGATGSGKSTLAKLMARLYDPDEGHVTFGEIDLRDATLASLRNRVVVVPQEGFLFDGTIADNLRLHASTRPTTICARRCRRSTRSTGSRRFPTVSPPRCASAVRVCRQASGSSCRWLARRSSTRQCWCSTRRRRVSIRAPRHSSNMRSSNS